MLARLEAGFSTPEKLAKRMGYSVRTVRQYERHGGASDDFCRRWSRHVGAPARLVFYSPEYFQTREVERAGAVGMPFNPVRLSLRAAAPKPTPRPQSKTKAARSDRMRLI